MVSSADTAVPTVVLTRQSEDNAALRDRLETDGLHVVEAPCLKIENVDPSREELDGLRHAVVLDAALFSSRNGVAGFFEWLDNQIEPPVHPPLVGAVGPATADALAAHGWTADVVPFPATGKALAEAMQNRLSEQATLLDIRGNKSRNAAANLLAELGHRIVPLTVYTNREPSPPVVGVPFDTVVLASPSAAARFFIANPGTTPNIVAIGPTTAAFLREQGHAPFEATEPTVERLHAAIIQLMNR